MPTLREYESSPKSGYYIQANVGAPHPITLQVSTLAGDIFRQIGYRPDDSVPTEVVWAMYDLDLLFTNGSLDGSDLDDISTENVIRGLDLGNRLSSDTLREIVSYIAEYDGPRKRVLDRLKEELRTASVSDNDGRPTTAPPDPVDVPRTEEDAIAFLSTITSDSKELRRAKRKVRTSYLVRSLQTFLPHPYTEPGKTKLTPDWNIEYPLRPPLSERTTDRRSWISGTRHTRRLRDSRYGRYEPYESLHCGREGDELQRNRRRSVHVRGGDE